MMQNRENRQKETANSETPGCHKKPVLEGIVQVWLAQSWAFPGPQSVLVKLHIKCSLKMDGWLSIHLLQS